MTRRIVRVVVSGQVQRVGYRAWTEREAGARGIEGWVCNRADGTVEAVFAGDPDAVAAMVESLSRGPHKARVTNVNVHEDNEDALAPAFGARFVILPTL